MTRSTQPGLRFRTRKLSPKQPLSVIREDQIDSNEYKELVDNQYKVETGVEKSEENVSLLFLVYVIPNSRDVIHFYICQYQCGHLTPSAAVMAADYNIFTSLPCTYLRFYYLLSIGIPSPRGLGRCPRAWLQGGGKEDSASTSSRGNQRHQL